VVDNQFHLAGKQWFTGDWSNKALQPAGPVPWTFLSLLTRNKLPPPADPNGLRLNTLALSNHYGLFAHYSRNNVYHFAQITVEPTLSGGEANVETK
jgi:hypothetical protein